jgi:hypothetical protein
MHCAIIQSDQDRLADHILCISSSPSRLLRLSQYQHVPIQVGGEALADDDDEDDDSEAGDRNPALNEEEEDDYDSGYESLEDDEGDDDEDEDDDDEEQTDKDLLKTFYFVCPPTLGNGDD